MKKERNEGHSGLSSAIGVAAGGGLGALLTKSPEMVAATSKILGNVPTNLAKAALPTLAAVTLGSYGPLFGNMLADNPNSAALGGSLGATLGGNLGLIGGGKLAGSFGDPRTKLLRKLILGTISGVGGTIGGGYLGGKAGNEAAYSLFGEPE